MKNLLLRGVRLPASAFLEGEGGGDDPYDFDLDKAVASPKAKQKIIDWAERNVAAGLKSKNQQILDNLHRYKVADGEDGNPVFLDPVEARSAIDFVKGEGKDIPTKIQSAVAEATGRFESQITSLSTQLTNTKAEVTTEITKRHDQMKGYELREALRDSGIKPGKLPLHEMYLAKFVKVEVDSEGNEQLVVLGKDNNVRYGKDGPMTLSEFIADYRDDDDIGEDWMADVSSGSGQQPGQRVPSGGRAIDQSLPPGERLRQHRRNQLEGKGGQQPRRA